jgi:hypothetical protein
VSIEVILKVFEGSRAMVSDRLMLLAIAEHANISGACWPSIDRLAKWCNTSPRNATRLINNLTAMGELDVRRCAGPKGANLYQINLQALTRLSPHDKAVTPDTQRITPDTQRHLPLTPVSPKPSLNRQEPSEKSTRKRVLAPCPEDVSKGLMADYLVVRKAKRAGPLTETALAGLRREAAKAGISLEDAITACCEFGWQGFNASWYEQRQAKGSTPTTAATDPDSREAVEAEGVRLGIGPWSQVEQWHAYKARVRGSNSIGLNQLAQMAQQRTGAH